MPAVPIGSLPAKRIPAPYRPIDLKITGTVRKLLDEQSGEGKNVPASDLRMLDALISKTVVRPRAASLIGLTFALTICA